jgi:outer membrane protein OmpA-like peptidoglycan-associated protein
MTKIKKHQIVLILILLSGSIISQSLKKYSHPLSNSIVGSLEGGTNYSFSDYEKPQLGWLASAGLEYYFETNSNHIWGFGVNGGIQNILGQDNNLGLPSSFETKIFNGGASLIYSYSFGKIFPFLSVGGSYFIFDYKSRHVKSRFYDFSNGEEIESLVADGIVGLKYKLSDITTIDFSLGYHQVLNDNIDAIKIGDYNDFFVTGRVGISVTLWNRVDSDNDGILDDVDKCPYEAEDIDGYLDEDGCPDLDNDKDGVLDINDGCPNSKEDFDGFQDDDGCPDVDNDGDGILDILDKCPNKKEDFDGFQDEDGCPDIDNDNDGILDVDDACPNKAEVFNGYKDKDGCPDKAPYYVPEKKYKPKPRKVIKSKSKKKKEQQKTTSNVPTRFLLRGESVFISGTAQIKSSAYSKLNGIAEQLKSAPDAKWSIEAHVDKAKTPAEAVRVSRNQALAIKSYLVSKGLAASNFRAIGMGDSSPIASNKSVYGRMKNRRIVIKKIN